MSLLLNALAFLPQVTLARLTASSKKCVYCGLRFGVRNLPGIPLPCGHTFGICECTAVFRNGRSSVAHQTGDRKDRLSDLASAELKCPICGVPAVERNHLGKLDDRVVGALRGVEADLLWERKVELRMLLEGRDLGRLGVSAEGEDDEECVVGDVRWDGLEMDFDDVFE